MNLKSLYNHFLKSPESAWVMQWPNAVDLYNFIKKNNVHRILGLGTGIGLSDAVIALAMQDKGETDYKIDSMEQFDKCVKLANELVPEELKKNLTIHKAEAVVTNFDEIPFQYFSVYDQLPEGDYDLIINDGPSPMLIDGKYVDLPNGTIHKLVLDGKLKAGTKVIYDGRVGSLKLLERYLGNNFFASNVPPRGSDFVVLERKEGEVVIKDDLLEAMKTQTPYFTNNEKDIISSDK